MADLPDYLEKVDLHRPGVAEFFDELPLWSAPFGILLLERVPMRNGASILDIGSGTGFLAIELAQRCGPDSTVFAVDPWEEVCERLRQKIRYLGLQNVRVLVQDAAHVELPDSSIDVVVSNLGVNNFRNADEVLETCSRVLRPGGVVILTSNVVGHMREFYDGYRLTLEELGYDDCLSALQDHVDGRATVKSMEALLERAGFVVTAVTERSFPMRFADGSSLLRHYFIRLGFLEGWAAVVPPERLKSTFAALERNLNRLADSARGLSLTIPMVCIEGRNE